MSEKPTLKHCDTCGATATTKLTTHDGKVSYHCSHCVDDFIMQGQIHAGVIIENIEAQNETD